MQDSNIVLLRNILAEIYKCIDVSLTSLFKIFDFEIIFKKYSYFLIFEENCSASDIRKYNQEDICFD